MKVILVSLLLLLATNANAQFLTHKWQRTLGGDSFDELTSCIPLSDGGFLLAGISSSDSSGVKTEDNVSFHETWLVKLDSDGNIVFEQTIHTNGADDDPILLETSDGGLLLGCSTDADSNYFKTDSSRGNYDYWLIKFSSDGQTVLWDKTIGGGSSDKLVDMLETPDGGLLLGGNSSSGISGDKTVESNGLSDYWIVKLSDTDTIQWQKSFGANMSESLESMLYLSDNSYLLGGTSYSSINGIKTESLQGLNDTWLVKIDTAGNLIWQKSIRGDSRDEFVDFVETDDQNILCLINSSSPDLLFDKNVPQIGGLDLWLVFIDFDKNIGYQNVLGTNLNEAPKSISKCPDGRYLISCTASNGTDLTGNISEITYQSDMWFLKINQDLSLKWDDVIHAPFDDVVANGFQTNTSIVFAGSSSGYVNHDKLEPSYGVDDYWILNYESDSSFVSVPEEFSSEDILFKNPASNTLDLSHSSYSAYQILNSAGQLMKSGNEKVIDLSSLNNGVYFIKTTSINGLTSIRKFMIAH